MNSLEPVTTKSLPTYPPVEPADREERKERSDEITSRALESLNQSPVIETGEAIDKATLSTYYDRLSTLKMENLSAYNDLRKRWKLQEKSNVEQQLAALPDGAEKNQLKDLLSKFVKDSEVDELHKKTLLSEKLLKDNGRVPSTVCLLFAAEMLRFDRVQEESENNDQNGSGPYPYLERNTRLSVAQERRDSIELRTGGLRRSHNNNLHESRSW